MRQGGILGWTGGPLADRRAIAVERFHRVHAATYDAHDVPITPTHQRCVEAVITSCPPGGTILDAALRLTVVEWKHGMAGPIRRHEMT